MKVTKPNALSYGQVWRTTHNRFFWILTMQTRHPEVWMAIDIENGCVRHFDAHTLKDTLSGKQKLTRIYGNMKEPAVIPNQYATAYTPGVDTPMVARLNRGLLRTFSGKLIKSAEPSEAPEIQAPPAEPEYDNFRVTWGEKRNLPPLGPDLNLVENQIVVLDGGFHMRVVGVYPNNPWKYHVVPAQNLSNACVSTFRADGSDPISGDKIVDVLTLAVHA